MARAGRGRDGAKDRYWRGVLRRWGRSGLSVREFCDCEAVSEASFYVWRRRLTQCDNSAGKITGSGGQSAVERTPAVTNVDLDGKSVVRRAAFLPVHILPDTAPLVATSSAPVGSSLEGRIELQLASGVRLWVPIGCDRQTLADVLAVLEEGAC
ncbi:MAG: IS66 family insertion sequence element accessory protein TnpA [Planctomycetales bacterium]